MKWRDRIAALDRVQNGMTFKVIASAVLVALAIAAVATYAVQRAADARTATEDLLLPDRVDQALLADLTEDQRKEAEQYLSGIESTNRAINSILGRRANWSSVAIGTAGLLGVLLAIVWLGVGLTSLGIGVALVAFCGPLIALGRSRIPIIGLTTEQLGLFTAASTILAGTFTVLLAAARMALGGSGPIRAIARNVIAEAVRMKVSIVFIVLLIFLLASIPGLLSPETPLRYRVQSFLQYGAGGSYWVVAILSVFLAVGTVAFEQRDRVIWQTATKPVPPWRYLLGKWIGVVTVAAVLLAVSCTGVFLFTEYLRSTPAHGEVRAYQVSQAALARGDTGVVAEDRLILETQILAARDYVTPTYESISKELVERLAEQRVELAQREDPTFRATPEAIREIRNNTATEILERQRSIAPGRYQTFRFRGLRSALDSGQPLSLQFRFDAGGNDPRAIYDLAFRFANAPMLGVVARQSAPSQTLTMSIPPMAVDDEGVLLIEIFNGRIEGNLIAPNDDTIIFTPDGLIVFYPRGSYHMNFVRAVAILWLKIAFLAAVGITAATSLSFAVASLVSFGVMLIAESSRFLNTSLEYYHTTDQQGNLDIIRTVIRGIAFPIAKLFEQYGQIRPVHSLVNGRNVGWLDLGVTALVMLTASAACLTIGWAIFRKRELATYSGQ